MLCCARISVSDARGARTDASEYLPERWQMIPSLEETKKAVSTGNAEQINAATDKLTAASHKLAEAMYKTAGPQPGGPSPDGQPGQQTADAGKAKEKDNVVDAEFVDVEDKK